METTVYRLSSGEYHSALAYHNGKTWRYCTAGGAWISAPIYAIFSIPVVYKITVNNFEEK